MAFGCGESGVDYRDDGPDLVDESDDAGVVLSTIVATWTMSDRNHRGWNYHVNHRRVLSILM